MRIRLLDPVADDRLVLHGVGSATEKENGTTVCFDEPPEEYDRHEFFDHYQLVGVGP